MTDFVAVDFGSVYAVYNVKVKYILMDLEHSQKCSGAYSKIWIIVFNKRVVLHILNVFSYCTV